MAIKIFIDQGHNPSQINAGAEVDGVQEADITFRVGSYLASLLNNDPRFEARLSRTSADSVLGTTVRESLQERVNLANAWGADYFLSIHANSNVNPVINGTEVYLYGPNEETQALAEDIIEGIVSLTEVRDNGVRFNPSLFVLRNTQMPALLVELAYMSNPEDLNKLITYPDAFALGIYVGLHDYFS